MGFVSRAGFTSAVVTALPVGTPLVAAPTGAWAEDAALTDNQVTASDVSSAIARTAELTDGLTQTPVESVPTDTAAAVAELPSGVTAEVPLDAINGVDVTGSDGHTLTITMPGADTAASGQRLADGTIAYPSDTGVANAVIPNINGVQLLTTIANQDAPTEYSYGCTVPADTILEDRGDYLLLSSDSAGSQGMLMPAWAKGADGRDIPSWYTWDAGVLTRHVDHVSGGYTYPVTADPGYSYSLTYAMNGSPNDVKWLLKTPGQFDRIFPVPGAPKNFPSVGQVVPLRLLGCNGDVRVRSESTQYRYFGWDFITTDSHIDGPGSLVVFEFRENNSGYRFMQISAWVNKPNNAWNDAVFRGQKVLAREWIWARLAKNINWGTDYDAGPDWGICAITYWS